MSEFKDHMLHLIGEQLRARPSTLVGELLSYDKTTGTASVRGISPSNNTLLKWDALTVPQNIRGTFGQDPAVGSQVLLNLPGGNTQFAQIASLFPPKQDYTPDINTRKRDRTWLPALARYLRKM